MAVPSELPVLSSLEELTRLVESRTHLYVRWSRGPQADLGAPASADDLTGVPLPGLSVNTLDVEPWWAHRPIRLWVARRLYDYCHLRREKGPGVRPWVLSGRVVGRGPDNEPLVREAEPIAWIDPRVIDEAEEEVARERESWGPLRRSAENGAGAEPSGSHDGA